MHLAVRQTDETVRPHGCRDPLAKILAQRHACGAANEFAWQITPHHRVITRRATGRPERLHAGQQRGHLVPVVEIANRNRLARTTHAGLMGEQLADRQHLLAMGAKFGPVAGDPRVVVELAFFHRDRHGDRGQALRRGVDVDQRVLLPRSRRGAVAETAPQIDDGVTISHYREARAYFDIVSKVAYENIAHALEAGCCSAVNFHSINGKAAHSQSTIAESCRSVHGAQAATPKGGFSTLSLRFF